MPEASGAALPDGRLEERFEDAHPLLTSGEALAESSRCLYCSDAPCMQACPTHIDVAGFIHAIASGNPRGSARKILDANLLGASCARVCPVEVLCEGACVYTAWGRKPIEIGRLQRYAMHHGASPDLLAKRAPTGRSVALVGAGPASLACAGTLALLGHRAVVLERDELAGGLNTTGVAPYKLTAASALAEVDFVRALGVEIQTGVDVGRSVRGKDLLTEYDAVFLGVGLGADTPLRVPGSSGPGVHGAVEWIRAIKLDRRATIAGVRRAAVIGGGNTAIDCVRELRALGVPDVRLVYRRGESEMSGYRHEWIAAKQAGVSLVANALVSRVVRDGAALTALELVRAVDGRASDEKIGTLAVDLVLVAIGQARLAQLAAEFPHVAVDDSGCFVGDPVTGQTGNPRVFVGGDARNGGKEVVNAVAEGQSAARAIDALFVSTTALSLP